MFRLFRELQRGEFFVVFGDCAQGGIDKNFVVFMSKTRLDIPLVLSMNGVAAEMTPHLHQALNWVHQKTGIKPIVALERNNGGSSAMHDLMTSNAAGNYSLYYMRNMMTGEQTDKLGWDTTGGARDTEGTRPKMLGEWLAVYNSKMIGIYDKEIQEQHQTFIISKSGKPQAAPNTHDDAVMACAGAYQLYQTENPPMIRKERPRPQRARFHV